MDSFMMISFRAGNLREDPVRARGKQPTVRYWCHLCSYNLADSGSCNGTTHQMTNKNPVTGYAPWFDDAPNGTFMAWFIPMDTYGVPRSDGSMSYGQFADSPATCLNENGDNCKPFALDYSEDRVSLKDVLQSMGMGLAFSSSADFSGMPMSVPLKIQDVIHKTVLKMDEQGTEAAGATAVIMGDVGLASEDYVPYTPFVMKINRPFIFAIYDRPTGTVLFLGRVMTPGI